MAFYIYQPALVVDGRFCTYMIQHFHYIFLHMSKSVLLAIISGGQYIYSLETL